ncbi:GNAT family N-acetyltransferase [Luteococcus sp. H138]|uniref:GNAT family N-acetyltransferase n=1 Tax=unclassified Luteococcus TaxID=2639923 RepID=UPI00313BAE6F
MEYRAARPDEMPVIRTVLARALADDPLVQWNFPVVDKAQERLSLVALYFLLAVERFVLQGRSFVAVGDGRVVGAALWMPPGMQRVPSLPRPLDLMTLLLGEDALLANGELFERARDGAPECEGFYLAQLGVLPEHRAAGVGSELMRYCMAELPGPLWAESANPRNVGFYQRLGFAVVHRAPLFDSTLTRLSLRK